MKKSLARVMIIVALGVSIWQGCSKKGDGPEPPKPYNEMVMNVFETNPLPAGFMFKLWAKAADTTLAAVTQPWIPLTRFNLNATGALIDSNGVAITDNLLTDLPVDLDDYDSLEITVERISTMVSVPSAAVYVHGKIPADLSVSHLPKLEFPHAFGQGISAFMLLTPTDSDTSDELSGVWFLSKDPPNANDSGLTLPPAPTGWIYEGWVHHLGADLSTGRFRNAVGTDLDNPYCGAGSKPAFPGEDFLQNAPTGLGFTFPFALTRGDRVSVALQPDYQPGLGKFGVSLLSTTLSGTIMPSTLTLMEWNSLDNMPSVILDIRRAATQ